MLDIESFESLHKRVLVLNRCYLPVHITTVKRAVSLLYLGIARGIDTQFQTYDWVQLSTSEQIQFSSTTKDFHFIRTLTRLVPIPRVIVLNEFERLPQRGVRFSRTHVFIRDQFTCQYCAKEFPKQKLNLDHVIPRSRGGRTSWENVVTSCHACNRRKANRTPAEANMPLKNPPRRPAGSLGLLNAKKLHESWSPFLFSEHSQI